MTGFLLAGVGNVDLRRNTNYLLVDSSKSKEQMSRFFVVSFCQIFCAGVKNVLSVRPVWFLFQPSQLDPWSPGVVLLDSSRFSYL